MAHHRPGSFRPWPAYLLARSLRRTHVRLSRSLRGRSARNENPSGRLHDSALRGLLATETTSHDASQPICRQQKKVGTVGDPTVPT